MLLLEAIFRQVEHLDYIVTLRFDVNQCIPRSR